MFFFFVSICLAVNHSSWTSSLNLPPHPEPDYHFYNEMHHELAQLSSIRNIQPFVIGHTVEKRPIWAFRSSNPKTPVQRRILIFAGLHALEWIGTEAALQFIERFSKHPIDGIEAVVVPIVNVDRRLLVEEDLLKGERAYRRSNAAGIDLNRDFEINRRSDAIWKHVFPDRYSTSPAPLSQPETRALDRMVQAETYDAVVSLHSFGGYIYYPWAGQYERVQDWQHLHAMATAMKTGQRDRHPYRVKQLSHWWFIFRILGSEIDHFYGKYNIPSFLIELTWTGIHPLKPKTWRDPFRMYNPINPQRHSTHGSDALYALCIYFHQRLDE
ncbi:MAG: hypothetical protein CMK59_00780 [Proteobacteria bacterium]|nr:hypothetical protein [Pseudomonadota bacterium]